MEPIQIEFESQTLKWVFNKNGHTIAVVCSNVIYVGTYKGKGGAAFFQMEDVRVLPIDALGELNERYKTASELWFARKLEINLFQVQAVFDFNHT